MKHAGCRMVPCPFVLTVAHQTSFIFGDPRHVTTAGAILPDADLLKPPCCFFFCSLTFGSSHCVSLISCRSIVIGRAE